MSAEACGICAKHESHEGLPAGPIHRDERFFIAHFPLLAEVPHVHRGHIIIEARRHITQPHELTDAEAGELGLWIKRVSRGQVALLGAEHIYVFKIGDKSPHLHFHLVPRYPGTPRDRWGWALTEWREGPAATPEAVSNITAEFRDFLAQRKP